MRVRGDRNRHSDPMALPSMTVTSPSADPPTTTPLTEPAMAAAPAPAHPVFDPFDPQWSSDPFPLYADLRERAPIHRNALGFWVVARHEDCLAILRDRRASSDSLNVDIDRMPEGFRTPIAEDDPVAAGHARDAAVPLPRPARPHPAAGAGVQGLHPQGGGVAAGRDPARWSTSCSTPPWSQDQVDLLEAFAYPAAGAGHLRPAGRAASRTRPVQGVVERAGPGPRSRLPAHRRGHRGPGRGRAPVLPVLLRAAGRAEAGPGRGPAEPAGGRPRTGAPC